MFVLIAQCCVGLSKPTALVETAPESCSRASSGADHSPAKFTPILSLKEGLAIAESYISLQKIDASSYWLSEDNHHRPCWYFVWLNSSGAFGDYIEIAVFMDGKAIRVPSM